MAEEFQTWNLPLSGYRASIRMFPAAEAKAPCILALHGFTGSGLDFLSLREAMGGDRYTWICPDFMGHGASDSPPTMDPYNLINVFWLIEFSRCLGRNPEKTFMLAYSMGARLALHFLSHSRGLPTAILGGSPGLESIAERNTRREKDQYFIHLLNKRGIESFAKAWEAQPVIKPQTRLWEPVCSELKIRRRQNNPVGLANSLSAWGNGATASLWGKLETLPPVACLYGEKDQKFKKIAHQMCVRNGTFRSIEIPNAAHAPHLEAPDSLAVTLETIWPLH